MVQQIEIALKPKSRGFHLVTSEILGQLPKLPKTGIISIFTKHTSSLQAKRTSSSGGLSINENCDPDVRVDMETIFNKLVPENRPEYEHTLEGSDDMPAHAKSTLSGVSITIPITNGKLNMGTWQGIYFCEFRNYGGARKLVGLELARLPKQEQ
jgi:secondary thiamine-phosphate synthase enzyme